MNTIAPGQREQLLAEVPSIAHITTDNYPTDAQLLFLHHVHRARPLSSAANDQPPKAVRAFSDCRPPSVYLDDETFEWGMGKLIEQEHSPADINARRQLRRYRRAVEPGGVLYVTTRALDGLPRDIGRGLLRGFMSLNEQSSTHRVRLVPAGAVPEDLRGQNLTAAIGPVGQFTALLVEGPNENQEHSSQFYGPDNLAAEAYFRSFGALGIVSLGAEDSNDRFEAMHAALSA